LFFALAFLFTASVSCEGGEKRTTAKNKGPDLRYQNLAAKEVITSLLESLLRKQEIAH
jgi:hypothetical protein